MYVDSRAFFWIDGSSKETIEESFKDIALDPQTPEIEKETKAVIRWLARIEEEWLLIFDNVDGNPSVVSSFLPWGDRGNLLFTSRNRGIRRYTGNVSLEVGKMEEGEAISLLLKAASGDQPHNETRALAKPLTVIYMSQ